MYRIPTQHSTFWLLGPTFEFFQSYPIRPAFYPHQCFQYYEKITEQKKKSTITIWVKKGCNSEPRAMCVQHSFRNRYTQYHNCSTYSQSTRQWVAEKVPPAPVLTPELTPASAPGEALEVMPLLTPYSSRYLSSIIRPNSKKSEWLQTRWYSLKQNGT